MAYLTDHALSVIAQTALQAFSDFRIGPQMFEERPGHDKVVLEHNGVKGMAQCQTPGVSHLLRKLTYPV